MSLTPQRQTPLLATAAAAPPALLQQLGMAGCAAVITVTFIHPIDVVKVSYPLYTCCYFINGNACQCNDFIIWSMWR